MIGNSTATILKDHSRDKRDKRCESKDQQNACCPPLVPLLLLTALCRARGVGSTPFFLPREVLTRLSNQPQTNGPCCSYQQIAGSQTCDYERLGELCPHDGDHQDAHDQHPFKYELQGGGLVCQRSLPT